MSEAKKKLLGLFRRNTKVEKTSREKDSSSPRSRYDKERTHHRHRRGSSSGSRSRDRRRSSSQSPRRESHSRSVRSSRRDRDRSRSAHTRDSRRQSIATFVLTSWPPPGYPKDSNLSQGKAMEFIASGAPVFKGHKQPIPHASDEYYTLYATASGSGQAGGDGRELLHGVFGVCSFNLHGKGLAIDPWDTLEQPSMGFCYGYWPGTITLNNWASLSGNPSPGIRLKDPGVQPRQVALSTILERLIYLESGFEEDYEDLMYKNLYKNLLRDPEKYSNPHKAMEKQIADLIIVLSRHEWIDFSKPENQVVAKFFSNNTYTDHGRYQLFFHQLLLSTELDLRIHSKHHTDWAKQKLLAQLPPCIAWDLALARRWHECMSIEKFDTEGDSKQIRFHLRAKKSQIKALRKFAKTLKWPNLPIITSVLKETDSNAKPLEDRSSDTMSYFTGMILPGVTLPWLLMNTLIDCDVDASSLAALTHMHPNSGFQYKSTTYWSSSCIVGKVLGPTCKDIAGWIGPGRPAPDLGRVQIARIRQRTPKLNLRSSHVESMMIRSDPLGPPSSSYPVAEYHLPIADPTDIVDTIRIEKLALKPISKDLPVPSPSTSTISTSGKPQTYDAAVQFAIAGRSWPLRLSYDVSFVASHPCSRGPHPLFFDYVYQAVPVDEILTIKDWGGLNSPGGADGKPTSIAGGKEGDESTLSIEPRHEREEDEKEKVLVIEAFGVADNEVLARAWCSHWGLSAVICDIRRTCMACAIREAYAACLNVVVMIGDGEQPDSD
ncbi:hypothetical protein B0O99DRAFT_627501 [Bisporella sp. PMI_857]|nr:hypothetical protein B0O99DRAFT_627501 [Bisporella sp. PMI_857]